MLHNSSFLHASSEREVVGVAVGDAVGVAVGVPVVSSFLHVSILGIWSLDRLYL